MEETWHRLTLNCKIILNSEEKDFVWLKLGYDKWAWNIKSV